MAKKLAIKKPAAKKTTVAKKAPAPAAKKSKIKKGADTNHQEMYKGCMYPAFALINIKSNK